MTAVIVIAVIVLVGGAAVVFVAARARRPKEEPVQHFKCPSCRRKLRYRSNQAGHKGMCPLCKQHLTFPAIPDKPGSRR
jgi:hypothetical protein